jgi:DNA-binding XRE family transcriptional regulator
MPRPERPVNAAEGPIPRFAAELRRLRTDCGMTYRDMASKAHFSKATLSAAAAGHRLPTWEVARAYVSACGGNPEDWLDRWQSAANETGQPTGSSSPELVRNDLVQRSDLTTEDPIRRPLGRLKVRYAISAITAFALAGAICIFLIENATEPTTRNPVRSVGNSSPPARFQGARQPVADNNDPEKSRCAFDPGVTTLDSVEINTPEENLLGIAQLRYSPRCRVAWGRFEPSGRIAHIKGAIITITARRPATGTTGTAYSVAFDNQAAFGNILLTRPGCVEITVTVRASATRGSATTRCKR